MIDSLHSVFDLNSVHRFQNSIFLFLCLLLSYGTSGHGQEPTSGAKNAVADFWLKVSRDAAESYVISPTGQLDVQFRLLEKPIFRHTQPVRGDDIGAMHLWLDQAGRPAAIGVMFAFSSNDRTRRVIHEFHSLFDKPITARINEKIEWKSNELGLVWNKLVDPSMKPAEDNRRRRLQVRQLARRFDAYTLNPQGNKLVVELTASPIHEYAYMTAEGELRDGFMFAFCHGTDTEVLLIVETRKTDEDTIWNYALAQFTDYKAIVSLDEKEIWQVPRGNIGVNGQRHFLQFMSDIEKPGFERE